MSAAMHRLLLTYARRFNKRTGRTGHLFQNRFDRRSLDTDWQVMEAIRSVHADPQEAGISLIERYPWSSFAEHLRAYGGDAADVARRFSDPSCVLELFGSAEGFYCPFAFDARRQRAGAMRYERDRVGNATLCRHDGEESRGSAQRTQDRLRPRGETESFSLCTMAATRCARSNGIRESVRVPYLVSRALMCG